ncbi:MAG: helix-turn-helix transcriptional regulator [Halobacteriaceae archaeon]
MESALEAIRFFASSANRVQVLTSLIETPATRQELQEEVEASRATVARILTEAETRGWVDSEGSQYWLTKRGEAMVTDFRSYLTSVKGHQHLGDMVEHLPPPLVAIDFRHLRDADIIEMTAEDPSAPFTRSLDVFREATDYRGLNNTSLPEHAKVLQDGVEQDDLVFEQVFEHSFLETIRTDPDRAAMWNSLADTVWIYEGVVPINLHIIDDTVLVWLGETRGEVAGLLESDNSAVLSWAESLYEEYRSDAKLLSEKE